jgi:hypothetical protein
MAAIKVITAGLFSLVLLSACGEEKKAEAPAATPAAAPAATPAPAAPANN